MRDTKKEGVRGSKLMIRLDYRDKRPIYEQIAERLKELMIKGILPEQSALPDVRSMAVDLSISPNIVQRAYARLEEEGYLYTLQGKGIFVAQQGRLRILRQNALKDQLLDLVEEAHSLGLCDADIIALISKKQEEASACHCFDTRGGNDIDSGKPADEAF